MTFIVIMRSDRIHQQILISNLKHKQESSSFALTLFSAANIQAGVKLTH